MIIPDLNFRRPKKLHLPTGNTKGRELTLPVLSLFSCKAHLLFKLFITITLSTILSLYFSPFFTAPKLTGSLDLSFNLVF